MLGRVLSTTAALVIAWSLLVWPSPINWALSAALPAATPAAASWPASHDAQLRALAGGQGAAAVSLAPTTVTTFTVNTDFDGVNPGACASNTAGQCTLREAVLEANANPGSTVVLPGLLALNHYALAIALVGAENGTSGALYVNADMSIVGKPTFTHPSVAIDASLANDRVFTVASGVTVNVSNVTIRHGTAANGGGIYNAGTLTLANSTVFSNTASGSSGSPSGGGIYNAGTLTLMNSSVTGNSAGGLGGGGISNGSGGTLVLSHSTVDGNAAGIAGGIRNFGSLLAIDSTVSGNAACCGGGIYNDGTGTLTLDTSTVISNAVSDDGGGINNVGLLTVTASTIVANMALVGGGIENMYGLVVTGSQVISNTANTGGGISNGNLMALVNSTIGGNTASSSGGGINNGGSMTIDGGTVISNTASGAGGGGILVGAGMLTLRNSTIVSNTASAGGGGIENGGRLAATNSTLSGNASKYGGGLYIHGAASLTNSTLDGNSAATGGGGFYQAAQHPTQTLSLANTIIANSPSGGNCAIDVTGYSPNSSGYNLSSDGSCAPYLTQPGDRNNASPNLGPLADNGGPTPTHLPQFPSPAIDAIPLGTNGCGTTLTTDQRGMARGLDGRCDIGAVENEASLFWLYLPLIER